MRWYNEKIWCWLILMTILICCGFAFASCSSSKKVITRQTFISDKQSYWDSLLNARVSATFEQLQQFQKEQRETSKVEISHIRDSTSTMVDKDGNILRKDSYHYENHSYTEKDVQKLKDSISYYKTYMDSMRIYQSKIASMQNIRKDSIPYPVYIEKQLTKKENMYLRLGRATYYFLLASIITVIILVIIKYRKKKL